MAEEKKEPFYTAIRMSPEAAKKMEAIRAGLLSKENADKEAPPIAGGNGEEGPPAGEPQEADREKQKKFGQSRASKISAMVRSGGAGRRTKEGSLLLKKTKAGEKIWEQARQEMEVELGAKAKAEEETTVQASPAEPAPKPHEEKGPPLSPEVVADNLKRLFTSFYSKWKEKGELAPELDLKIKKLMDAAGERGLLKPKQMRNIAMQAMRDTGYADLLPRRIGPRPEIKEPEAKAKGIKVHLKNGEELFVTPEEIYTFQKLLADLEKRQELYHVSHEEQDDPKLAAEIGEVRNVPAEAAKAGWIKAEEEPLGPPAPEPGPTPEPEPAPEPPPPQEEIVPIEPIEPTAPEVLPNLEARLTAAREAFIQAEKNWEKYLGITGAVRGWFGGKAAVREEYERSREQYAEARAEMVGADISIFLEEEAKLTDQRIQTAMERKKGLWEKASNTWKWLGDQNLEKLGWKPQGRFGRIIARGANLRMAAGLVLMGMAAYAGPGSLVALGAIGARRAMAGAGATMFSSEWLGRRAEVSRTTVSDKELEGMGLDGAEARLGDMVVGLRMQGKLASESEDYRKLFSRYEALLKEQYRHLGDDAEYLKGASVAALEEFYNSMRKFKGGQDIRRAASIAAGVGAAVGVSSVLRYLYGAKEAAGVVAPEAPGLKPPAVEYVGPEVGAGSPEYNVSLEDVEERIQAARAEAVSVETISAPLPDSFELTVQPGEGPIHEARKAIAIYIAESGEERFAKLTKAQRILAEGKLYRAVKDTLPEWKVGAKVSFPREAVERVVVEAAGKDPAKLAGIEPFTGRVNWPRYEVIPITYEESGVRTLYKPWEWDEGIRRVVKGTAKATEVAETPRYVPFDPAIEEIQLGKLERPLSLTEEEAQFAAGDAEDLETRAGALKEAEPELSQVLVEESKEAEAVQDAILDARAEEIAGIISRLDPEEYRAIKDLKVSEVLKKAFFGTTEETIWPSSRRPNHMDLWRKGKLRDSIAFVLERLSPEKREEAAGLTIHQFIKEYYLKER